MEHLPCAKDSWHGEETGKVRCWGGLLGSAAVWMPSACITGFWNQWIYGKGYLQNLCNVLARNIKYAWNVKWYIWQLIVVVGSVKLGSSGWLRVSSQHLKILCSSSKGSSKDRCKFDLLRMTVKRDTSRVNWSQRIQGVSFSWGNYFMKPQETTQEHQDLIGKEAVDAKPNEVL